jgi:hypothetical protein
MTSSDVTARAPRWTDRWWSVAPDIGIYIGAGCISTAIVTPASQRARLSSSHVEALPEGIVVPSPVESNIRRPDVVVERLKAALSRWRRREAAISLPDAAVRVAILELSQVPGKREEREALFRHHLEHLFLNPLGRCRFASQRLMPSGDGKPRLLVAAIRDEILEEYEAVVRAAGLRPSMVDLSAFHLFNHYEPRIHAAFQPGQSGQPGSRVLFLNLFDRNFTMIVADRNGPRLIRIKAFPGGVSQADWLARVLAEIDASLRASDAVLTIEEQPIERLFVFSDRPLDELNRLVREDFHIETTSLWFHEPGEGAGLTPGEDGAGANGAAGTSAQGRDHAVTMALAAVGRRAQSEAGAEEPLRVMS